MNPIIIIFYYCGKNLREVVTDKPLTPQEIDFQLSNLAELHDVPADKIRWEEQK